MSRGRAVICYWSCGMTGVQSLLVNRDYYYNSLLAVSTRPPDGDLSRFALEFSRPLQASVRSFISIHQVAPNDLDLDLD